MALNRRDALILGGVGVAAAAAGVPLGPTVLPQSGSGAADLLAASFKDLAGRPRQLLEWRDKVLVCNFWATRCAPCREEIPLLVSVRDRLVMNGVEIAGIAIDSGAKASEFSAAYKISRPVLMGDAQALDLMRKLGNIAGGRLPFTVFLDRRGAFVHHKLGPLRRPELEQTLTEPVRS